MQNRNEFYKGWQIMIIEVGNIDSPTKIMMAVKGLNQIDFDGSVIDENQAIKYAQNRIDQVEKTNTIKL
mgnify:CR=1 FL=1